MDRRHALSGIALAAALAGCASMASTTPGTGSGSGSPAAPAAATSAALCLTHQCIAEDLDQELVGIAAQDESVSTKAACKASTVKHASAADTYTARCTVTYSDGSTATGYGNLLMRSRQVTFQPDGS